MRNYILALGLVMLTAASSFAQLKAKGAATVSERPPAAFVRDKFDPARNPSDDLKAAIETASAPLGAIRRLHQGDRLRFLPRCPPGRASNRSYGEDDDGFHHATGESEFSSCNRAKQAFLA